MGVGGGALLATENFWKFAKIFEIKVQKSIIFARFTQNFIHPASIFSRVWRKTKIVGKFLRKFENFWWKFNRKIDFKLFLEKMLLKIEPSEITSFFYDIFSISEGGRSRRSPWLRHWLFSLKVKIPFRNLRFKDRFL